MWDQAKFEWSTQCSQISRGRYYLSVKPTERGAGMFCEFYTRLHCMHVSLVISLNHHIIIQINTPNMTKNQNKKKDTATQKPKLSTCLWIYKEAQKPSRLTFQKKQQAQLPLGRTPKSRLAFYIAQEHPKWYNCKSLWRSSSRSMKNTHSLITNKNQGNGNVQQGFFAPHSSLENKWKKAWGRVNLINTPLLIGWYVFPLLFDWVEWSITSLK